VYLLALVHHGESIILILIVVRVCFVVTVRLFSISWLYRSGAGLFAFLMRVDTGIVQRDVVKNKGGVVRRHTFSHYNSHSHQLPHARAATGWLPVATAKPLITEEL
jgi:hypothetical protein